MAKIETGRRSDAKLPPFPLQENGQPVVWLPNSDKARLALLNWKVWTLRYRVDLETLINIVLETHERRGRRWDPKGDTISLGHPISVVTGINARHLVEESVLRMFPNGENYKAASQPPQAEPNEALAYGDERQLVEKYTESIGERRKSARETVKLIRNYRGKNGYKN